MGAIHQILFRAIKDRIENVDNIERQRKEITTQVKERTQILMDLLKKLENKTLSALDSVIKVKSNEIGGTIKVLKSSEQYLGEILEQKDKI